MADEKRKLKAVSENERFAAAAERMNERNTKANTIGRDMK